jgi:hypothetical protein
MKKNFLAVVVFKEYLGGPGGAGEGIQIHKIEASDKDEARSIVYEMHGIPEGPSEDDYEDEDEYYEASEEWEEDNDGVCVEIFDYI